MIHSEQPKGGQFKLVVGDLIRLIETQHEHQAEQLAKLGGITGVATSLGVNITQGLNTNDSADLKRREDTFGSNYIPPPKAKGLLELMWEAFQDVTIIVLTISGVLSVILAITVGDHPDTGWIEGACIIFAVLVVTMVTAINDYQKEAQFRALNAVKEDEKIKVSKFGLVVGDIVRVDLGDIVPADGIVFDQKELKLDESAMTGEKMLDVPSGRYQDLDESHKHEPTQHMTVIFNTFVWMQLFNELNCRKIHDEPNVLEGLMGNRVYIYVTILQILMQLVIVQCTGSFFNCEPLTASQWGVSIGLGAISMPLRVILRCFSAKWLPAFCKDADAVDVQSFPPVAKVVRKGSSQKAIMQQ
ncbi:hypothetical protein AM588_10010320 [Phytophthora nicotianae]|uniref:Cation-transporting P-type ATPase N-terminal domain-containing protein n=1 Tax=Phytophthora nicotianae TaxID=4792 RepID=A0A0W8DTZ7_PHYNI|nr:hypothetical protein AM588_10010320 [Phytophthora nicotianae]